MSEPDDATRQRTAPPSLQTLPAAWRWRWSSPRLLDLGVPAAIRVAEMLISLAFLAWLNASGPSLAARLTKWDANYYATIASSGYPSHITLGPKGALVGGAEFAFYPAYPALADVVRHLGFTTTHALLLTSALAGIAASIGVHLLTMHVTGSRRAGWYACAGLGVLPMAITLQMGYAESLFVAAAAFALLAARQERWWLAGALALLAGLTRPGGILIPLAIPVTAWALRRRGRSVPWLVVGEATVLGLLGSPLYWLYLWARTGVSDAWFTVERHGWDSHIDFGKQTWQFLHLTLQDPDSTQFMGVATVASIVLVVLGCLLAVVARREAPLIVVTVLGAAMTLGATNYWHSKPRLLLACFPLVVLVAPVLARLRTTTAVALIAVGVLASAWFGAYALDIWPYAV